MRATIAGFWKMHVWHSCMLSLSTLCLDTLHSHAGSSPESLIQIGPQTETFLSYFVKMTLSLYEHRTGRALEFEDTDILGKHSCTSKSTAVVEKSCKAKYDRRDTGSLQWSTSHIWATSNQYLEYLKLLLSASILANWTALKKTAQSIWRIAPCYRTWKQSLLCPYCQLFVCTTQGSLSQLEDLCMTKFKMGI